MKKLFIFSKDLKNEGQKTNKENGLYWGDRERIRRAKEIRRKNDLKKEVKKITYYPEIVVAALDIIGMKNLLKKKDKLDNVTKIIVQLCFNIENNPQLKIHWKQFGDSAYLFGNPGETLDVQLNKISFAVANLTALGIFGENLLGRNFLLGSGIAIGDLSSATWKGSKKPFFIGNSMKYAVELERAQNWFGACIKEGTDCSNIKSDFIILYDNIPLKNKDYKGYAVNWMEVAKQNKKQLKIDMDLNSKNICDQVKRISDSIGWSNENERKTIETKIENTKKFVNFCLE